jgi:hypothetical protein
MELTKKEIWAKIAEARVARKTFMDDNKQLKVKMVDMAKEDRKLAREKVKENNSKRNELLAQIKELYAQKAVVKEEPTVE